MCKTCYAWNSGRYDCSFYCFYCSFISCKKDINNFGKIASRVFLYVGVRFI